MPKKVKKKINKKGLLVLLLALYLFIMVFYYFFNLPVKLVTVKGNEYTSYKQIIDAAKITKNSKLFSLSKYKIEKNLKKIPIIKDVSITKKLNGNIIINIKESQVLYYKVLDNKYILGNGKKVDNLSILSSPSLVNYVPSDIEESLIKKLSNIKIDILQKVSEIEYSPDIKDETVIDKNRFLLRMNDGNYIYINIANMNNLNKYDEIYATLSDEKGILNLDSSSENGIVFQTFDYLKKKEAVQNELSEES